MPAFPGIVTSAGEAALATAVASGSDFPINRIKLGTGQYAPSRAATDIVSPFSPVREFTNPSGSISGNDLQFTFHDEGTDTYNVGEVGVFSGNTLFIIASQVASSGYIFAKTGSIPLIIPVAITLTGLTATAITFTTSQAVPIATLNTAGVIQLATDGEAKTGTVANKAITPLTLKAVLDDNVLDDDARFKEGLLNYGQLGGIV